MGILVKIKWPNYADVAANVYKLWQSRGYLLVLGSGLAIKGWSKHIWESSNLLAWATLIIQLSTFVTMSTTFALI